METAKKSARFIIILILVCMMMAANIPAADESVQTIRISARKFEYTPNEIRLKKGVPVILEFTSSDRLHGFNCPGLGVRSDIPPGKISRVRIKPEKAGTYEFFCDNYCGEGHENMTGRFVVEE